MSDLSSTAGVVAVAAGAVAVVALATSVTLSVIVRRLRSAQRAVLGDESRDLVAHAARLQSNFETLANYVHESATRLDTRMTTAERRLDGAIAYRSLVRYDAYGDMSGQQSWTTALLDANRSGVVLTSIHHRDTARLYAKQVHEGEAELALSPEELQAIEMALKGGAGPAAAA